MLGHAFARGAAGDPRPLDRGEEPELAEETALAHPLPALDQDGAAPALRGFGESAPQPAEHLVAPDEPAGEDLAFREGEGRRGRCIQGPPRCLPEVGEEPARRGIAVRGIALEQALEDARQLRRHVRPDLERVGHLPLQMEADGIPLIPDLRGEDAGRELEQGHAERIEIGAMVVIVLQQDLGRGVGKSAADAPVERTAGLVGQSEVQDLETGVLGQTEIGRLEVHVNHTLAMDVGQTGRGLNGHVIDRVPAAVAQRDSTRDELHGQEGEVPGKDTEVVDLDDVGVAGLGEQADLVAEAREVFWIAGLERDLERQGAAVGRAGAHAVHGGPRRARDLALEQDIPEQTIQLREVEAGVLHGVQAGETSSVQPRGC